VKARQTLRLLRDTIMHYSDIYIQDVPGGIVNILGGSSVDYSNFQWV